MTSDGSGLQTRNPAAIRRRYDGSRRVEAAAQTRRRIVAAAAESFERAGYRRTTLPDIARSAGVSVESVAANGPKRELLIAAFSQTFAGEETEGSLSSSEPWAGALRAPHESLARVLAQLIVEGQRAGIGMWRTLVAAVRDEPELEPLYSALAERRRADNVEAVQVLAARGVLRPHASVQQHADTAALLTGFDPYQLYVLDFGHSEEWLREWTATALQSLLLAPPPPPRSPR